MHSPHSVLVGASCWDFAIGMRLMIDILLQTTVDIEEVRKVFPYGQAKFEVPVPACLYVPATRVFMILHCTLCGTQFVMCLNILAAVVHTT